MIAGIYDPYLDTLGGGERYCLTVAEALLSAGWRVDIFWPNPEVKNDLQKKLGLKIDKARFVPYEPKGHLYRRWQVEKKYDLLFYLSDGSLPSMFGKTNILHFQVPLKTLPKVSVKGKIKLKLIKTVVCNSHFTKGIIDTVFDIDSKVLYPPVDVEAFRARKKEKMILSVGRFSQLMQSKKQDVLVEVFKSLSKKELTGWRLVLAGGSEVGGADYVKKLKAVAKGFPVEIKENASFSEVIELYGKASIYWSASGFGADERLQPQKTEHFGIAVVEAMAAGCVPVVLGKGGHREIVKPGENGFLWTEKGELISQTVRLANDSDLLKKISKQATLRSKLFSKMNFYNNVYKILKE